MLYHQRISVQVVGRPRWLCIQIGAHGNANRLICSGRAVCRRAFSLRVNSSISPEGIPQLVGETAGDLMHNA